MCQVTAEELLLELADIGVSVTAAGSMLVVKPAGRMTDGQRRRVIALKPDLLVLLQTRGVGKARVKVRSPALRLACRELPCQHCGARDGSVVAAHSNWADLGGKGMGTKADDRYVAALCWVCHHQLDQGFLWDARKKREIWMAAHTRTIDELVRLGKWPHYLELPQ